MRTIIAGSRSIINQKLVNECANNCGWEITQVVSGGADGVDRCGEIWAFTRKVPIVRFLPDWERYGNAGGAMRNMIMAKNADALICVWDGKSSGTKHMLKMAGQFGLKTFLHRLDNPVAQPELAL